MRLAKKIVIAVAGLSAALSLVYGQGQSANAPSKNRMIGTWQVLRHGANCDTGERLGPDFPSLMTFNKGGTLNAFAVAPGEKPSMGSPEYGNWSREPGTQTVTARDVSYGYDKTGAFTGRGEVTFTITLDTGGDSFTYSSTVDVFDADGNPLFSFCGMGTGTRFK